MNEAEAKPAPPPKTTRKKKDRSFWKELPVLIIVALFLTLIIKTYAIQAFYIPSGSMQNTLGIGDRVLVNKLSFDVGSVHRGDIVVFSGDGTWDPGVTLPSDNFFARFGQSVESMFGLDKNQNDFIKRVIGLPGDHVACCNAQGRVTVNGVPLNETSYLYPGNPPSQTRFSVKVPAGSLWVMGDHRDVSYDSRGHEYGFPGGGAIPEDAVVGRAFIKIWPLSQWGLLSVPSTFDQPKLSGTSSASAPSPPGSGPQATTLASAATATPATPPVLYGLGFAGAVPLTLLQRKARRSLTRRHRFRRPRS